MTLPARSIQAEYSEALVDEWSRAGVRHAVVSPGSRSSLLALALLADDSMTVHVRLDERSGAFFAIGIALATRSPVVVVTTSGTAAAEVHAAIAEADLAHVALILACADRPVELRSVGAPQTIDQSQLFGSSLRYFFDLPVAEEETRGLWRSFGSRAVAEAINGPRGPGPVQLNVAFREPMVGPTEHVPPGRPGGAPWHEVVRFPGVHPTTSRRVTEALEGVTRGVVVAGGHELAGQESILGFARRLGWPVVADSRAIRRRPDPVLIAHADQFLRSDVARTVLRPDLVVHLGSPHASKTLSNWNLETARAGTVHLFVDPHGSFEDPERLGSIFVAAEPNQLFDAIHLDRPPVAPEWLEAWQSCDRMADKAIAGAVGASVLSEPGIARTVFSALGESDTLFCSSSMPIRDVEWFCSPQPSAPRVLANRGANGIDGVISSVLGAAATSEGRTVGLVGDLAFFHDLSGLVWGDGEVVPNATIVVVDNRGGGIFSFLSYPDFVDEAGFERAFGTPQRQSVVTSAAGLGCHVAEVDSLESLSTAVLSASGERGIRVIVAATDRNENVALHAGIAAAVSDHVEAAFAR